MKGTTKWKRKNQDEGFVRLGKKKDKITVPWGRGQGGGFVQREIEGS